MKKLTIIAAVLVAILLVLVSVLIGLEVRNNNELPDNTDNTGSTDHMDTTEFSTTPRPWEQSGAKQPEDYTWEEFLNLSPELQVAFQYAFGSADGFEEWMNRVQPTEPEQVVYPWAQPGAKQPEDYTWEEFLALSPELQMPFQDAFGSSNAFEAWMNRAHPTNPETEQNGYPWEQPGAKQPVNYTWEEFLALSPELQIAFQGAFGSEESFEDWLNRTQPTNPEQSGYPWDQPGAKRLEDYTWEEFLALSPELQISFQNSFSSTGALEEWLDRVQRTEPEQIVYPWAQPGGKQPEDYTWEEFLDLPPELQIAFQFAFRSADGFEKWMNQKMPKP
jgi:hypothetical protein